MAPVMDQEMADKIAYFKKITNEALLIGNFMKEIIGGYSSILDVGGGNGEVSMAACRNELTKCHRVDIVDPFASAPDDGIINAIPQRWEDYTPTRLYDLIIFSHVIVWFDEKKRTDLVFKALDYLAPGGKIVVVENCLDSYYGTWYRKCCFTANNTSWFPSFTDIARRAVKEDLYFTTLDFNIPLKIGGFGYQDCMNMVDIFFPFPLSELGHHEEEARQDFISLDYIPELMIVLEKKNRRI